MLNIGSKFLLPNSSVKQKEDRRADPEQGKLWSSVDFSDGRIIYNS